MSSQYRHNGRFARKKKVEHVEKCLSTMNAAKKRRITLNEEVRKDVCIGRRIVDLPELGKNLKCGKCQAILSLEDTVREERRGLHSILHVTCKLCKIETRVPSGKISNDNMPDVNVAIVLGCTGLNKILACLDAPATSNATYKRYEGIVGASIEAAAKESCKKAAEEERRLVIQNLKKLSEQLPHEVVQDIYPELQTLESSVQSNDSCNFDSVETFDAAVGNIISIIVSYDMGWSKRGNGRSYDSLNGYSTIIGFLSGKVLDFATRNRACKYCDLGHEKNDHDCRCNFKGSAKAMEADAGAQLITRSKILEDTGLQVRVVIGDEDSSTIASVKKQSPNITIHKLADKNHLVKHFSNDLYELAKQNKELNRKGVIAHIKKCFTYAISQNKGKSVELQKTLKQITDHLFSCHENCGEWCHRSTAPDSEKVKLKDLKLYEELSALFDKYAQNAYKFSVAASSQGNESVNNIIAHKAPKNVCLSRRSACDIRVADAITTKNDGEKSLLNLQQILKVPLGTNTAKITCRFDQYRQKRAERSKLKSSKLRRHALKEIRDKKRISKEKSEGVQYQSNCGMNAVAIDTHFLKQNEQIRDKITTNIVYFDLETSSLKADADLLQIAARCEENEFNVYVTPSQPISPHASKVNGLSTSLGELYFHTVCINDALHALHEFLNELPLQNCLMVAHNARFDTPRLLRAIINNNMLKEFQMIAGFSDTLALFKKDFPDRKGAGQLKLLSLAIDFLKPFNAENLHDAAFDVKILQELLFSLGKEDGLFLNIKTFTKCISDHIENDTIKNGLQYVTELKGVVSPNMLKKLSKRNITFNTLISIYKDKGENELTAFLSEKVEDKSVRVTKDKKIIAKIVDHIKKQL